MRIVALIAGLLALASFILSFTVLFVPTNPNYPELHDHVFFSGIITGCGFTLIFIILCYAIHLNKEIELENQNYNHE